MEGNVVSQVRKLNVIFKMENKPRDLARERLVSRKRG